MKIFLQKAMHIWTVGSWKVCSTVTIFTSHVTIFIYIPGDIIVQIDRQELSHMTLAQATLALGTTSPLLRLSVYRPAMEDGMSC